MNNFIREKIAAGQNVCGIWSIIPSPILTEIFSLSKFDFQIFDMEHGVYDFQSLDLAIRTAENNGCSPLVRIAGLDPVATQKALDLGAHGIIFPQVSNGEQASIATRYTKYSPEGTRGFNPFTRVSDYGLIDLKLPNRNKNDFAMAGIIIESQQSADNIDQILKTPNLEIVYLGAYDMSVALGCPGDMKNPALLRFLETSVVKIRKMGKVAGVMAQNSEDVNKYTELGANLVVLGVDTFLIGKSSASQRNIFPESK